MKRILLLFAVFFTAFMFSAIAQRTVTGKVTDETGESLPGANVVVEGTTTGTTTDLDGNYSLSVPEGGSLKVSFIGYQDQVIELGAKSVVDVSLEPEQLDDVVVVGYSEVKKESLTGSSKQFEATIIQSKSHSNVSKALAGEVAGVNVINSSGQPGSSARVRIRGFGSISGLNDPLYVVDGIPYEGSINAINQSDIESLTVLKDASATAIYGSRGSNGVVVITTKKGKDGSSFIEFETKTGLSMELLPRYDLIKSPDEYTELSWDILRRNLDKTLAEDSLSDEKLNELASVYLYSDDRSLGKIPTFYNMYKQSGVDLIDPSTGKLKPNVERRYTPGDWNKYLFSTGVRTENNLKFSGGNDKTRFYTSLGYLDDNGYAKGTNFNRLTARLNVNHKVKEWLQGSVNLAFVNAKSVGAAGLDARYSTNPFFFSNNIPSIYPVFERDSLGNKIEEPIFGGYLYDVGSGKGRKDRPFGNDSSPLVSINYDKNTNNNYRFIGNQYLEAKIIEGLTLSTRFGVEFFNTNNIYRINPFYGAGTVTKGRISRRDEERLFYSWTKMLRYENEFGEHKVGVLLAHENSSSNYRYFYARKTGLVNPFGDDLDNAIKDESASSTYTRGYAIESYFGQLNYEYSRKYIASLTARRDGSSKFSTNKWDTFGAVGLAWRVSQENFLSSSDIFKELKLRTSYGLTGSQGTDRSDRIRYFYANQDLYTVGNVSGNPTLSVDLIGNPELTWEVSKMFQVGADFNIANIVEGSFDYYIRDTENMFYDKRGGISLGYAIVKVNDGKMRNSGFEFDIKTHVVNTNDFKFDITLNGEMISNKITAMPINPATGKQVVLNRITNSRSISTGESYYKYYMPEWEGVDPETGLSQWASYYDDKNNNNKRDEDETIKSMKLYLAENANANVKKDITNDYSEATQKYIDGKYRVPNIRGAFGLSLDYKGIVLTTQFLYGLGGYLYDSQYANYMGDGKVGNGNYHVDVRNRWKEKGDKTDTPRFRGTADVNATSTSTRFLTKMDFLALNNIKLGYNFSKKMLEKIKLQSLSIFVAGDNLWVGSHRKGLNPSTYGLTSDITYNPLSTATVGLNVKF